MNEVLSSGSRAEDEGLYPIQHGYWEEVMEKAVETEDADFQARTSKQVRDEEQATRVTAEFAKAKAAAKAASASSSSSSSEGTGGRRRRRRRQ